MNFVIASFGSPPATLDVYSELELDLLFISALELFLFLYTTAKYTTISAKITNTNITKLDLERKFIGDEGLKDLCKIEFKELKELDLGLNNISDIKVLENVKFEKLEILDLENNKIDKIKYSSLISKLKSKIETFRV